MWKFVKTLFRAGGILIASSVTAVTLTGQLSRILNNFNDIRKQTERLGVIDRLWAVLDEVFDWLKGLDWTDFALLAFAYAILLVAAWYLHTRSFEIAEKEFESDLEAKHPGLVARISKRRRRRSRGRRR